MNTIFKRVISGAAALGIAVSGLAIGVSTAYAADPTTGSITINKSKTDQVDHSFDGWHLASLTNITKDNSDNINGFLIDTDDDMVGTIVAAMTSGQKDAYEKDANYFSTDNTVANPMGYLVEKVFKDTSGKALSELTSPWGGDSSSLRAFAESLSKKLAETGAPAAYKTGDTALKTGENKNLEQGLWFLKDVTTTDDVKGTNSIPIITPTTFDGADSWGTVTLKNTTTTIDKKLVDPQDDGTYTPNIQPDYAVGDDVYYELTSTVPVYTVSVTGYGDANTPDTDAYKGGHVTTIDLGKYVNKAEGSKSATSGILEGAAVTVIVKAKLNKDALISEPDNLQKNPNKVDLEYSNRPEDVNHAHKVPGSEVPVYAYKFGVLKTDKAGTTKLPGASSPSRRSPAPASITASTSVLMARMAGATSIASRRPPIPMVCSPPTPTVRSTSPASMPAPIRCTRSRRRPVTPPSVCRRSSSPSPRLLAMRIMVTRSSRMLPLVIQPVLMAEQLMHAFPRTPRLLTSTTSGTPRTSPSCRRPAVLVWP